MIGICRWVLYDAYKYRKFVIRETIRQSISVAIIIEMTSVANIVKRFEIRLADLNYVLEFDADLTLRPKNPVCVFLTPVLE